MKLTQFNSRLIFTQLLCDLIKYIGTLDVQVTIGEVLRMEAQQKYNVAYGLSKTMDSYHLKGLAIDINLFKNGKVLNDDNVFKSIASHWESLHENCRAGYFWGWDLLHFEFHLETAKKGK